MTAIRRDSSCLLLVDLQLRLLPAIDRGEAVLAAAVRLLAGAQRLGVPVLATEHCADKIGPLVPEIRDRLAPEAILPKRSFAATADPASRARLAAAAPQIVACGIEAHVCLLQATLGLLALGKQVFVVADAAGSRHATDRELALARLARAGAVVVASEMVLFEWLEQGDDPAFRDILRLIK